MHLKAHVCSYLQLLALVPTPMLPSVTATVCRQIMARDSNNSFGIRSLEDDGSEFFGWGVWPEASFFNHSCQPAERGQAVELGGRGISGRRGTLSATRNS